MTLPDRQIVDTRAGRAGPPATPAPPSAAAWLAGRGGPAATLRTSRYRQVKDHGGKSDALNAGLNISRAPLVAAVDADSILEPDALRFYRRGGAPDTRTALGHPRTA